MGTCPQSLINAVIPPDGTILLSDEGTFSPTAALDVVPFNAGVIIAKHGQVDRLGYADYGVWTGAPLPEPKTCPSIPDVPTCGGYCGGCPVGQICTGRSPLHPYGICVAVSDATCPTCSADKGCFTFKVEPAHQAVADTVGFCLPLKECQALAANLPGGGFCK